MTDTIKLDGDGMIVNDEEYWIIPDAELYADGCGEVVDMSLLFADPEEPAPKCYPLANVLRPGPNRIIRPRVFRGLLLALALEAIAIIVAVIVWYAVRLVLR